MSARALVAATTAAVALSLGATAALATSGAHFFNVGSTVNSDGSMTISYDEAGVGNATVNYTVNTNASATYACINGGGNHPKAANKESTNGTLSVSFSRDPNNGRVTGSTSPSIGPLSSTLVCPSGQTFVLACVSYTGTTLTDTTNNVTTPVPDAKKTFVAIKGC